MPRPRLLVSVASADEAAEALAGGADIIDAKDPLRGALGPVTLDAFEAIVAATGPACPISAALGEATDEDTLETTARRYAAAGARFVKIGFAGVTSATRVEMLLRAAVRGASAYGTEVVAVAYADDAAASARPLDLIDIANGAGAAGVLIDTADKNGPSLLELVTPSALREWACAAHARRLGLALAGRLMPGDLDALHEVSADIIGVRGAACEGGRAGRVSAARVRDLRASLEHHQLAELPI